MINTIRGILRKPSIPPVILFLVCLVAYGIYLPWMGFYWDDWPWIWRYHVYGLQAIRQIDVAFRPLAGIVLWIGARFAGESAFGWQIYNFIIRWLGGVALWWSLCQIWPKRRKAAMFGAILFTLYPGFGQQFISINSSRHMFPLLFFILSIGFTARAYKGKGYYWASTGTAVALSIFTMFTTEYYYGLELARVVILALLIKPDQAGNCSKFPIILKAWAPYLIPLVGIYVWRFSISQQVNYRISLVHRFSAAPFHTIKEMLLISLTDLVEVSIGALSKLFSFPESGVYGPRKTAMYWVLAITSAAGTFIYAAMTETDPKQPRWNIQALVFGGLALWISGLPFWTIGLDVRLTFPSDRLTLPMMVGFGLVTIALIDLLKPWILQYLLFATLVGLAVGGHFQNAVSYQRDWEVANAFFQQLSWRVPGLMPDTAVLSPETPIRYSTDNSVTAPLNWIYGTNQPSTSLPYGLLFLELRLGTKIPSLDEEAPIKMDYGPATFSGSTSQAIVLQYDPPACLRVLDPEYDRHLPGTPEIMDAAMKISNTSRIQVDMEYPAALPEQIFKANTSTLDQWCYYFQKADLARQVKDWQQVASLGDTAFNLEDSPNHASERVPFIEGYAHVGDWETAVGLTLETIEIDKFMGPMLCDTWERVIRELPSSESLVTAVQKIEARLACGFNP
jgi:hypothetical protein